jgi:hypothetical protein
MPIGKCPGCIALSAFCSAVGSYSFFAAIRWRINAFKANLDAAIKCRYIIPVASLVNLAGMNHIGVIALVAIRMASIWSPYVSFGKNG